MHPEDHVRPGPLVLSPRPPDRSVGELLEALPGHVLRIGRLQPRDVEAEPDPLHGRRPGHPEDQLQHVDAVVAQLQPETLGEDLPERLHPAVDRVPHRAHRARPRADQHDAAAPAVPHPPAEVVDQGERGRDVEVDDLLELDQVAVEELLAVRVGAGVVDEQPDLDVLDLVDDPRDRVRGGQVECQGPHLDSVGAAQSRRLLQRDRLAGDEHQVEPGLGELGRERPPHTLGAAGDHRPGAVASDVGHARTLGHCSGAPFVGRQSTTRAMPIEASRSSVKPWRA